VPKEDGMDILGITWIEVFQHSLKPSGRHVVFDLKRYEVRQAEPRKCQAP